MPRDGPNRIPPGAGKQRPRNISRHSGWQVIGQILRLVESIVLRKYPHGTAVSLGTRAALVVPRIKENPDAVIKLRGASACRLTGRESNPIPKSVLRYVVALAVGKRRTNGTAATMIAISGLSRLLFSRCAHTSSALPLFQIRRDVQFHLIDAARESSPRRTHLVRADAGRRVNNFEHLFQAQPLLHA